MRTRIVGALVAISVLACAHNKSAPTAPLDSFGTLNGARIEISADGGIATLSTNWRVSHDDRSFVYARRHICGATCPAPFDSASGILSAAAADSLFSVVWSLTPSQLRDDYGTTPGAADMFEYVLRITFDGTTKTVHADDGTMPAAMRQIVSLLATTIDSARVKR